MTAFLDRINAQPDTRYLSGSLIHALTCYRPEPTTTLGHCVTIGRCPSCGGIVSLRHGARDKV